MWKGVSSGRLIVVLWFLVTVGSVSAADCNQNDIEDWAEITSGALPDCNGNGIPDPCDILPVNYTLGARGGLPVGPPVTGVAAADLDGDGDTDAAVSSLGFLSIAVLWNRGEGVFSPPTRFRSESSVSGIAAGDIDGDRDADLVVGTSAGFLFLFNRGSEHFSGEVLDITPASTPIRSVDLADLDGDGDLDIASTAPFRVVILLNPGDGSYNAQTVIPVGSNPVALAFANMDGDRDLDIVTANRLDNDQSGNVSVLLNDGSGSFSPPRNFGVDSGPFDVAAGDLDGDGDADVVAACISLSSVRVLFGSGDGALSGGESLTYQKGFPFSVWLADLDGDRDLDLCTSLLGRFGPGIASIQLNHGNATFAKELEFPTGFQPNPILTADLTGDGVPEVTAGLDNGTLLVLERVLAAHDTDCDGSRIPDACELPERDCNRNSILDGCDIAAGDSLDCNGNGEPDECEQDCNSNGKPDECDISSSTSPDCNQNGVPDECDIGPSAFRFDVRDRKIPGNNIVLQLQSEDLDRDGHMDVFGFQPGFSAVVFWNDGHGALEQPVDHGQGIQVNTVGSADIDGDQDVDLLVGDSQLGRVVVLEQDNRSFRQGARIAPVAFPIAIAAGDIDRDGDADIVVTDGSRAALQFFSNDGDGTFTRLGEELFLPTPHLLVLADLDVDGAVDLIVIRPETGLPGVFWNELGRFVSPTDLGGRSTPGVAKALDMDGDGDLDVVMGLGDGFTIAIQESPRGFRNVEIVVPFQFQSGFTGEDFDGDGDVDLAGPTFIPNIKPALAVFRNRGDAGFEGPSLTPIELFLGPSTSGDYDEDGKADVIASGQPFCVDGACLFEPLLVTFRNRTHVAGSTDDNRNGRPDDCEGSGTFRRGDSTGDGSIDVADAVFTLRALFRGGPAPACAETADTDNDGTTGLADAVLMLEYLFHGGPSPAAPGAAACGLDPDPDGSPGDLGCERYDSC